MATLEEQIAALVSQANTLTEAVSGKIGEIDQRISQGLESLEQGLEDTKLILPRIVMTKNQRLTIDSETGLPESFSIHSAVTSEVHMEISGSPSARDSAQIALLSEIETDTGANMKKGQHYRFGFNVIKLSWSSTDGSYLAFPQAADDPSVVAVPTNSFFTLGAFVKVLSGSISGSWGQGSELGKWRFCSSKFSPAGFGTYTHLHPYRGSTAGEVLIALPAAITGHIDSPNNWFPNISLG